MSKLTPEVREQIVQILKLGHYIETAAAYAGISKQTLYNWLRRGAREKKGIYHDFHREVTRALAEAEIRELAYIDKSAKKGSWQAAAWILSRRFPKRWGKEASVDVSTPEKPQRIIMDFGQRRKGDEES